jgi:hypothetical protein
MINSNKNRIPANHYALFPNYVKLIGAGLLIITGFVLALMQTDYKIVELIQTETVPTILRFTLLLGLFLIASSQDKVEDELVALLRLKAFGWSFRWGIVYSLIDLVLPNEAVPLTGFSLTFSMHILYLLIFYSSKRERNEE